MAVKCSSCGYANHNPDAKACELCQARLKPAEGKAAATAVADSGDDDLQKMASAATEEAPKDDKKAAAKAKDASKAGPKPEAETAAAREVAVTPRRKTGAIDLLLFVLSFPVSFPAAITILLRSGDFAAVPATVWLGQGLLALIGASAYTMTLGAEAAPWMYAVLPAVAACALAGSLLLVRIGETGAGWAGIGVLVGGACLVSGTLLAMRGGSVFEGHADTIRAIDLSADGERLVSVGEDGTLRVWNVRARRLDQTIKAHQPVASAVRLDPASGLALTGGADGLVCSWDLASPGAAVLHVEAHRGGVLDLDFARDGADGRILTGGVDGAVRVWNLLDGEEQAALTQHEGAVTTVAWSPDGKRAASGGTDGSVLLWTPPGAAQELEHHQGPVMCLAWSPDGTRLVSGGDDRSVCVWNTVEGGDPQAMKGPGAVRAVAFLPDGKRVVTAHDSRTIVVWQLETGLPLGQHDLPAVATALAATPDGAGILAATGRTIRFVELSQVVAQR